MDGDRKWNFGVFAALRETNGSIWLVKHNYGQMKWSLPGGSIQLGELPNVGVCREVKEETGFEIEIKNTPIGIFPQRKSFGIVMLFDGAITKTGVNRPDPREISKIELFSYFQIRSMAETGVIYPAQFGLISRAINTPETDRPVYDWMIPPINNV